MKQNVVDPVQSSANRSKALKYQLQQCVYGFGAKRREQVLKDRI
jgi:hypothetical protein